MTCSTNWRMRRSKEKRPKLRESKRSGETRLIKLPSRKVLVLKRSRKNLQWKTNLRSKRRSVYERNRRKKKKEMLLQNKSRRRN